MDFRAGVRAALSAPLGGSLPSRFGAAAVTAIVADAFGDERDEIALTELSAALVHAGVPRGRQFVLLSGPPAAGAPHRVRAAGLRQRLGVPVLVHDAAAATFEAGRLTGGRVLRLDDELREAEAIVLCGRYSAGCGDALCGGGAALLPGLAAEESRAELDAVLAGWPPAAPERRLARLAAAREAVALVPVDYALLWSADEPPRFRAGVPPALFEACEAEGWLAAAAAGEA